MPPLPRLESMSAALKRVTDYANDVTPQDVNRKDLRRLITLIRAIDVDGYADILRGETSKTSLLMNEVVDLVELLVKDPDVAATKRKIHSCKKLFRGTCGLGMTYFIGYRPTFDS